MAVKKLGANDRCGCGSDAKYKRCCMRDDVRWFVDSRGIVIDERLSRMDERMVKGLDEIAQQKYGRRLRYGLEADVIYEGLTRAERLELLLGLNLPSEIYHAYETTGKFVPIQWYKFFRLTNVIPLRCDRNYSSLTAALEAIVEYDRIAGGDAVPKPEYMTLEEVLDDAQKHRTTMDNQGSRHMMQPTGCRGCRFSRGLLSVLTDGWERDPHIVEMVGEETPLRGELVKALGAGNDHGGD